MAEGGSAGGRRALTRALILTEALRLVDEQGLDALSFRALGRRLDVSQTAFYRHVPDKAALLEGIAESIWREALTGLGDSSVEQGACAPCSPASGWRAPIERYAWRLRTALTKHPHAVMLMLTHPIATPSQFGVVADAAAELADAGYEIGPDTLDLITAVTVYTMGFSAAEVGEAAGGAAAASGGDAAEQAIREVGPREGAALMRLLAPMSGQDSTWSFSDQFAPGLNALLRGWRAAESTRER